MTDHLVFVLQLVLLVTGCLFFAVGTLGLFRFPDTLCRIHALTKVDNLGLGFIALALLPLAPTLAAALKILLIWLVVLAASATSAHLVALAVRSGEQAGSGREHTDD
jgi:multicomponent Na+:H+ antiporter subunit G